MPVIHLAERAFEHGVYGLPPERLVNLYKERQRAGSQYPYQVIGAPGLKEFGNLGPGPIRMIFQQNGVLNGGTYVISGSDVYVMQRDGTGTVVGAITGGTDILRPAADADQIAVASGGLGYVITTSGVTPITDGGFPTVSDVIYINGYFVWLQQGNDQYVWSNLNDATSYESLDFATAGMQIDGSVAIVSERNTPIIMGQKTFERLRATGAADAPFVRLAGGVYDYGCVGKQAIAVWDNSIFWVDRFNNVYRLGDAPQVISTEFISEKIAEVPDVRKKEIQLIPYTQRSHSFIILQLPTVGTYVYDTGYQEWHERQTRGQDLYRVNTVHNVFGKVLAGSRYDGKIYELDADTLLDDDQEIERIATANIISAVKRGNPIWNLAVEGIKGTGVDGGGQGADPQIMMRFSKDGGNKYSNELWRDWGKTGKYNTRAVWRGLGDMGARGLIVEFDMSDPVKWTITRVTINDDE